MLSPVDFLFSPEGLNLPTEHVYPRVLEGYRNLFEHRVRDALIEGEMGSGKTLLSRLALARTLYEILASGQTPQDIFGFCSDTYISLVLAAETRGLAGMLLRDFYDTLISKAPCFRDRYPVTQSEYDLRFPSNVWVAACSFDGSDYMGLNIVGAVIEDSCHRVDATKARSLIRRRMKSRLRLDTAVPNLFLQVRRTESFVINLGGEEPNSRG